MPEVTEVQGDQPVVAAISYEDFALARNTGQEPKPATTEAPAEEAKTAEESGTSEEQKEAPERDDQGRFKAKESEVPPGVQKRIDKAIAKQRDAERRADEAERRLAAQAKPAEEVKPSAAVKEDAEPTIDQFTDYDQFVKAVAKFEAQQFLKAERKADAEAKAKSEQETTGKAVVSAWQESEKQAKEAHSDYQDVMDASAHIKLSDHLQLAVLQSDMKAELAYHLGQNPAELERLTALSPDRVYYEVGKIEAKLQGPPTAKPEKKVTSAPKPPAPVGTSGNHSSSPEDAASYEDFVKKRNAQLYRT